MKLEISVSGKKSEKIMKFLEFIMKMAMEVLASSYNVKLENMGGIVYYDETGEK